MDDRGTPPWGQPEPEFDSGGLLLLAVVGGKSDLGFWPLHSFQTSSPTPLITCIYSPFRTTLPSFIDCIDVQRCPSAAAAQQIWRLLRRRNRKPFSPS